jgi:hypothetical protein
MGQVEVLPESLEDYEYPIPCATSKCDEPAKFYVLAAHHGNGCPSDTYFCQPHLDAWLKRCDEWLTRKARWCICGQKKPKTAGEQSKVMPL